MMRQNCEEFKAQRKCGTYIHSGKLPQPTILHGELDLQVCSNVFFSPVIFGQWLFGD